MKCEYLWTMNTIDRTKLNLEKIRKYPTFNDDLDAKYGNVGTESRDKFSKEAQAFYSSVDTLLQYRK